MLPLGQTTDVRQYLASHMPNRERYPKPAPYKTPTPQTGNPGQAPSSIITRINTLYPCAAAAHACQTLLQNYMPPADHQSAPSVPAQEESCKSYAKAPSKVSIRQLSFRTVNLSYRNRPCRSSNNQRPVAQTNAVAVSIAFFVSSRYDKVNGNSSCATSPTKDRKKGSSIPPQDDDTFRCYHGCLIA